MDKQAGGMFPSISRATNPLDVREENFQNETKNTKEYQIKARKLPDISVTVNDGNDQGVKLGVFNSTSKANFRADVGILNAMGSDMANQHTQWVKPNEFEGPGSYQKA